MKEITERRLTMKAEFVFPDDGDRLLSLTEVAERLRTSGTFIGRLVDVGLLPCLRFRKNRRIRKFALNEFLQRHEGEDLYEVLEEAEGRVKNRA